MFEEICLQCGKPIQVDGRAYCSDECESLDATSPSISSSSSAFPSPHMSYSMAGPASDVPALVSSALGTALASRGPGSRYSLTSLSSSNWSSSALTDEDDDDGNAPVYGIDDEDLVDVPFDPSDGTTTKSSMVASALQSLLKSSPSPPSSLAYARRPSTTNTRSTVPHLHRRISSTSSSSNHKRSRDTIAKSAPTSALYPPSDDDTLSFSDSAFYEQQTMRRPQRPRDPKRQEEGMAKPKSRRNRASLPAYFALLQMGSNPSSPVAKTFNGSKSKISSSSVHTIAARLTPPTPTSAHTLTNSSLRGQRLDMSEVEKTPRRGRRRERPSFDEEYEETSGSRRTTLSRSPSRSRASRQAALLALEGGADQRAGSDARRTSSALEHAMPKMTLGSGRHDERSEERRGRLRREELDMNARAALAPGFGSGRTGLRDRERAMR